MPTRTVTTPLLWKNQGVSCSGLFREFIVWKRKGRRETIVSMSSYSIAPVGPRSYGLRHSKLDGEWGVED